MKLQILAAYFNSIKDITIPSPDWNEVYKNDELYDAIINGLFMCNKECPLAQAAKVAFPDRRKRFPPISRTDRQRIWFG